MEGYIGEVIMFAGNFAPRNWAFCQGQIINIASNTALFSILGTNYGGNGSQTFALPNFSGRVAIGAGNGAGLSNYQIGQVGGSEMTTLTPANLPAHTHLISATLKANAAEANSTKNAAGAFWGFDENQTAYGTASDLTMAADAVTVNGTLANTGANVPFTNMQPYIGMNFVICTYGIYPSRN
ncbi:MAG: phage tail protein [Bacteroidia bacterium]